jgi:hypothetical protein
MLHSHTFFHEHLHHQTIVAVCIAIPASPYNIIPYNMTTSAISIAKNRLSDFQTLILGGLKLMIYAGQYHKNFYDGLTCSILLEDIHIE